RSRAKFRLRKLIGDDRNFTIHQWQQDLLAVQVLVALITRVYRHGRVPQHRFRARGRDRDEFVRPNHGIANLPKLAGHLLVLNLEIGNRRLAAWTPVDDVLSTIDQPSLIESN